MSSPLADLDELVLKCRSDQAKNYIKEAVACYKAGAFRSAVVSTWIAISFDLLEKLKELSIAGDAEASSQISVYEKYSSSNDIAGLLRFEKSLLDIAQEKLGLISEVEKIDLERVQVDRNRCAHLSTDAEGDIFIPSAEIVRAHIRSAIEHLLQYPPVQGRYALDRIMSDINSEYFPHSESEIEIALSKTPFARPRKSLVRSLIVVLLKDLIKGEAYKARRKKSNTLKVISRLYFGECEEVLAGKLSDILRNVEDERLLYSVLLLRDFQGLERFIDADVMQRLQIYVENMPSMDAGYIEEMLNTPAFAARAERRVRKMNRADVSDILYIGKIHACVADKVADLYSKSESFSEANMVANMIIDNAEGFSRKQVEKIALAIKNNSQVAGSKTKKKLVMELSRRFEGVFDIDD